MGCGRAQCKRTFRGTPLFCRCGLEFCSEACFVSAWHAEHQYCCPHAATIKEGLKTRTERSGTGQLVALALTKTRPEKEVQEAEQREQVPERRRTSTEASTDERTNKSAGIARRKSTLMASIQRWRSEGLESFELGEKIGNGSSGEVTKVRYKKTNEIFAMKSVPKQKVQEQGMQAYLMREVQIQMQLAHPCIVQLHYYFEDQHNVLLLLEYANGGSLFSLLRSSGQLAEADAARYFVDVALALCHLHSHTIVHRDLKPENILMCGTSPMKAKLADFGWCAELQKDARTTFCGTWDYLSPEMVENQPHDSGVDIWAIGILLFEMLTGRAPFAASSQVKVVNRIINVDLQVPSSVPPLAADLMQKLIKRLPHERLGLKDALKSPWVLLHAPTSSFDLTQTYEGLKGLEAEKRMPERGAKELQVDSPRRRTEASGKTEVSPASTVMVPAVQAVTDGGRSEGAGSQSQESVSPASTVQVAASRPKPSVMPWSEAQTPTEGEHQDAGNVASAAMPSASPQRRGGYGFGLEAKEESRAGSKDSSSSRPAESPKWHETDTYAAIRQWMRKEGAKEPLEQSVSFKLEGGSRAGSKESSSPVADFSKWEDTNTYAAIRQWVRTGTVKAENGQQLDLTLAQDLDQSRKAEDGRVVPQPKRKNSKPGDFDPDLRPKVADASEDGMGALHDDVDLMQQRLRRRLAALVEAG